MTDNGIAGACVVVTYQYLCQEDVLVTIDAWKQQGKRIALFCDEIHHIPEGGTAWSNAYDRVMRGAVFFGSCSATWWRTDERAIKGQEAEGNFYPHFSYSYANGLRDGWVRDLSFWIPVFKAGVLQKSDGLLIDERPITHYLEKLPPHVREALFNPDGPFVEHMIMMAYQELERRLVKYPDAACLVVCPPG